MGTVMSLIAVYCENNYEENIYNNNSYDNIYKA